MSTTLLMIGGILCAIGGFIIPSKLQERQIDEAVERKFKEREKED